MYYKTNNAIQLTEDSPLMSLKQLIKIFEFIAENISIAKFKKRIQTYDNMSLRITAPYIIHYDFGSMDFLLCLGVFTQQNVYMGCITIVARYGATDFNKDIKDIEDWHWVIPVDEIIAAINTLPDTFMHIDTLFRVKYTDVSAYAFDEISYEDHVEDILSNDSEFCTLR